MSNVKRLSEAETAERIDQTLGGALEDTRAQVAEIVAERDRLKALNAELVSVFAMTLRRFKDELPAVEREWEVGTRGILDRADELLERAQT